MRLHADQHCDAPARWPLFGRWQHRSQIEKRKLLHSVIHAFFPLLRVPQSVVQTYCILSRFLCKQSVSTHSAVLRSSMQTVSNHSGLTSGRPPQRATSQTAPPSLHQTRAQMRRHTGAMWLKRTRAMPIVRVQSNPSRTYFWLRLFWTRVLRKCIMLYAVLIWWIGCKLGLWS